MQGFRYNDVRYLPDSLARRYLGNGDYGTENKRSLKVKDDKAENPSALKKEISGSFFFLFFKRLYACQNSTTILSLRLVAGLLMHFKISDYITKVFLNGFSQHYFITQTRLAHYGYPTTNSNVATCRKGLESTIPISHAVKEEPGRVVFPVLHKSDIVACFYAEDSK